MDPTRLAPAPLDGAKKQRAIQDARDMSKFVARSAERAGCAVPPYEFLELIGKGGSGRVYKCRRHADGELVAVKLINTDEIDYAQHAFDKDETIRDFKKEVSILSQLRDSNAQNVNLIHDAFSFQEQLWIVSDYCTGGSVRTLLRAHLSGLEERYIIPIARELALAMKSVHDVGFIHRDIKCTNVYINERGDIQLGDFGIVGTTDDDSAKRRTIIGTPHYMAPELHLPTNGNQTFEGYGGEVDIWAYGCSVYEMATGHPPHGSVTDMNALDRFVLQDAPRLEGGHYSEELRDFIAFCLTKDASQRPSAEQILRHPYVANTQKSFPSSALVHLIEQYKMWEMGGGQRLSLFMPGGAPDVPSGPPSDSDEDDDTDWNFSTSNDFDAAFERRYSQIMDGQGHHGLPYVTPADAGLPRIQTRDLSAFERFMQESEERSATRGEHSLKRLWNPDSAPYELHTPLDSLSGDDLPLRSAQSAPARESQVMIDLDEGGFDSNVPSFTFDFGNDIPTLKARRSRMSIGGELEENDDYQYGSTDADEGEDRRNTMEWSFPKRATMDWTFPKSAPGEEDIAAKLDLLPLGDDGDYPKGSRPVLKHTTTVPVGQFGDFIHSTPPAADVTPPQLSSSPVRMSMASMIDLDLVEPVELLRPSTACSTTGSASGSIMTDMTSGNPFDLEEEPAQAEADRNRFSYHKQWQSEGGQIKRISHKSIAMHARGNSLSSTDSDPMSRSEGDVFDKAPKRALYLTKTRRRQDTMASDMTDTDGEWPSFDSGLAGMGSAQARPPEIEFPSLGAPHVDALTEDATPQMVMSELSRLLDDFAGALTATTTALKQYSGWDDADEMLDADGILEEEESVQEDSELLR